ncbi:MAG: ABC transporter ATP-binding protein [Pirellulaceae bacterium]
MFSSEAAIVVEGLGKRYRIGGRHDSFPTLRDSIARSTKAAVGRVLALARGGLATPEGEMIWALRDVSFEVKRGDVLGIIGSNGAGKSTLLKILSRITDPTEGWANVFGRVGSMLEVGTGFHPELTGRENLYLNGSILGMKRAEIERRFDEIVEFSGVAAFLDTPVKHYSNGMYVRLAFAVAAHLDPEILIVDEVLAVGDAGFQRKCLAKMEDVSAQGRTVLFVSHNMGLIQTLCQRAILLRNGSVYVDDTSANVVAAYLKSLEEAASANLAQRDERRGQGKSRLVQVQILGGDRAVAATLVTGWSAQFVFHVTCILPRLSCSFTIYDQFGQPVTSFDSAVHSTEDSRNTSQGNAFVCHIDELMLTPGRYRINAAIMVDDEMQDHLEGASFFQVEQGAIRGRPVPGNAGQGSVFLPHCWRTPS